MKLEQHQRVIICVFFQFGNMLFLTHIAESAYAVMAETIAPCCAS